MDTTEQKVQKQTEIINIKEIVKTILSNKKRFYLPMSIVFVISAVYIFSQPRYYTTDAKLAPEMGGNIDGGTLGAIASSFGFNIGDLQTTDAITPLLYPDLMDDNAFVAQLFQVEVENSDGDVKTNYYDYLKKHQKKPWWGGFTSWLKKLFEDKTDGKQKGGGGFNPYLMTKVQDAIAQKIRNNITLSVDKKSGVITVNVKDQDPFICKTMADTIISKLQTFITEYRTNKARTDYEYYKGLADNAKNDYEKVRRQYASLSDANTNVSLRSVELMMEDVENDMQLKHNTYSALMSQFLAAKSKVQERTPAFTILKGAALPIKPAGPKRVIFIAAMMILAFMVRAFLLVRKDIHMSI
jgi:uncharacterized protein involved in exopolysaccharide biosynthesis